MKDEEGIDTKIMAVPKGKVEAAFKDVSDIGQVPEATRSMIAHFFSYYKSIEPGKWAEVSGWEGKEKALEQIRAAVARVGK